MSELILYTGEDDKSLIQLRAEDQAVRLTQAEMAELFDVTTDSTSLHLKYIFSDKELEPERTTEESSLVQREGGREMRRTVTLYSLDAILAVSYRVRSQRGVQFRRWASTALRQSLKSPDGNPDHFDEMLARIRDIRASEKRFYQKVRDLFALSVDYDRSDRATQMFLDTVQNLLSYAATGRAAAELIMSLANPGDPQFGLRAWSGGRVRKQDNLVAKNYLSADQIDTLNRLVVIFLEPRNCGPRAARRFPCPSVGRACARSSVPMAYPCPLVPVLSATRGWRWKPKRAISPATNSANSRRRRPPTLPTRPNWPPSRTKSNDA